MTSIFLLCFSETDKEIQVVDGATIEPLRREDGQMVCFVVAVKVGTAFQQVTQRESAWAYAGHR